MSAKINLTFHWINIILKLNFISEIIGLKIDC